MGLFPLEPAKTQKQHNGMLRENLWFPFQQAPSIKQAMLWEECSLVRFILEGLEHFLVIWV